MRSEFAEAFRAIPPRSSVCMRRLDRRRRPWAGLPICSLCPFRRVFRGHRFRDGGEPAAATFMIGPLRALQPPGREPRRFPDLPAPWSRTGAILRATRSDRADIGHPRGIASSRVLKNGLLRDSRVPHAAASGAGLASVTSQIASGVHMRGGGRHCAAGGLRFRAILRRLRIRRSTRRPGPDRSGPDCGSDPDWLRRSRYNGCRAHRPAG